MSQLIVRATYVTQPEENVRVSEKLVGEIRIKEELIFIVVVVIIVAFHHRSRSCVMTVVVSALSPSR